MPSQIIRPATPDDTEAIKQIAVAAEMFSPYEDQGYDEEARIRQFYGPEDDKVVFWKSLVEPKSD